MQKLLTARWKGRSVMTLKELKQAVGSPRGNGHYKKLKKGDNLKLTILDIRKERIPREKYS